MTHNCIVARIIRWFIENLDVLLPLTRNAYNEGTLSWMHSSDLLKDVRTIGNVASFFYRITT